MTLNRYATRRDENEKEIVKALESIGCTVYRLDAPVDLIVGYRARNILLEVKDGTKSPSRQRLTPAEMRWHNEWRGQVAIVNSVDAAIEVIQGEL